MYRSKYLLKSLRKVLLVAAAVLTIVGVLAALQQLPHDNSNTLSSSSSPLLQLLVANAVVDVSIIKCWRSSCKVPDGYTKVVPLLDHANPGHLFRYYLVAKHQPVATATRVLVELQLGPSKKDVPGANVPPDTEYTVLDAYTLTKRFVATTPTEGALLPDTEAIRDVEVLFGTSDFADARPFHHASHYTADEQVHPVVSALKISATQADHYLKQLADFEVLKQEMTFPFEGPKFKVLQLSDLHFGQATGKLQVDGSVSSDLRTIRFVEHSLDEEKPDLVVITGDLVDLDRSIDYRSVLLKALQPILSRNLRFVFTFGDELLGIPSTDGETSARIILFLSSLPNCYNSMAEFKALAHGTANYNIKVVREGAVAAHITVLDAHQQKLENSQMNYLYRINNDFKDIYKLLFFHYPLPQFRPLGKFKIVGSYNEKHPLNSKTDSKFLDDIINCGYQAVGVGHEHENDACILSEHADNRKIWLCYNSATGDSAHTRLDSEYVRKLRLFQIDFEKKELLSWKRNEKDKSGFDYMMIHPIP
ncbi:uncharacterized protein CANTADRAFT_26165 [Suhomyces tanzawaensis NRRL Y-17324]|uniref:Calcineurin-like phosphoesterase domain-containing protein n=1 Tax=Suhomyces tanzawaensis NRRL Y-17324 TaxID=984487 RepID=A0A1E4SI01_9ASCO|nr:uncharacterized protein CANTADRAFT_26165 [Suhomyces tanzawaensis NRRL Y-17324]ODV79123.1 hypothetical protein CANTADRAFT_26165 [Suhomyces tanzawaensis NRRL Y-17324]